jgi:hypothetical protein
MRATGGVLKAVFDPGQRLHDPKHCILSGRVRPYREQPARVERL